MDKNILIVGLLDENRKSIAQQLADKLSMIYLDIDELIDYQLVNRRNLNIAGRSFFDKIQESCMHQATECVNTVASLSTELYLCSNYAEILSSFYVIFINFTKNDILSNLDTYPKERHQEIKNRISVQNEIVSTMRNYADLELEYVSEKQVLDDILLKIGR